MVILKDVVKCVHLLIAYYYICYHKWTSDTHDHIIFFQQFQ